MLVSCRGRRDLDNELNNAVDGRDEGVDGGFATTPLAEVAHSDLPLRNMIV